MEKECDMKKKSFLRPRCKIVVKNELIKYINTGKLRVKECEKYLWNREEYLWNRENFYNL